MGTGATIRIFGPFFPQQGTDFASSKRICMPFAIFRASVLNFTLESLVPNIRISRSNGSWLFNRTCNTGSRFTESMSGSSYTQVLPLKPSSMTRYSAPKPVGIGISDAQNMFFHCLTLRFLFQSVTIQDQYVRLQY